MAVGGAAVSGGSTRRRWGGRSRQSHPGTRHTAAGKRNGEGERNRRLVQPRLDLIILVRQIRGYGLLRGVFCGKFWEGS
jgi:hypothetical protein